MCTKITQTRTRLRHAYKCVVVSHLLSTEGRVYSAFLGISNFFEWLPKKVVRAYGMPLAVQKVGNLVESGFLHCFVKAKDAKTVAAFITRHNHYRGHVARVIKVTLVGRAYRGINVNTGADVDDTPSVIASAARWDGRFLK